MTRFDMRVEWLEPPPANAAFGPERYTWARLRIFLDGEPLTLNHPADTLGDDEPWVVGGMSGLAEWIVDCWLPIHLEIHTPFPKVLSPHRATRSARFPSLRDAVSGWPEFAREGANLSGDQLGAWQQRHTLGEARSDIALPSIVFVPEGAWMGIGLDHLPAALSPTVRFTPPGAPDSWPAAPVWVPLDDVSLSLRQFVEATIQRATAENGDRRWIDWLRAQWGTVQEQAKSPQQARQWMFGEVVAGCWPELEARLGNRMPMLRGVLTDSALVQDEETLDWLEALLSGSVPRRTEKARKSRTGRSTPGPSPRPTPADWMLPPYHEGYRLAQEVRRQLELGDRPLEKSLAEVLEPFRVQAQAVAARGLFRSAVWSTNGRAVIAWAKDDPRCAETAPRRFAIAAALGRLLSAHTEPSLGAAHGDQARWRPTQLANALAAELLLPSPAIHRGNANAAELSKRYDISRSAAEWHVANRGDQVE